MNICTMSFLCVFVCDGAQNFNRKIIFWNFISAKTKNNFNICLFLLPDNWLPLWSIEFDTRNFAAFNFPKKQTNNNVSAQCLHIQFSGLFKRNELE